MCAVGSQHARIATSSVQSTCGGGDWAEIVPCECPAAYAPHMPWTHAISLFMFRAYPPHVPCPCTCTHLREELVAPDGGDGGGARLE